MKNDLSDLCKGDTVFSINYGHIRFVSITYDTINTNDEIYYIDGKLHKEDMHPSLFHSIDECIEYFQSVKKDIDEASKPKKRYWLWDIRNYAGEIAKTYTYYDDNGYTTNGRNGLVNTDWHEVKIRKHESEFIDV